MHSTLFCSKLFRVSFFCLAAASHAAAADSPPRPEDASLPPPPGPSTAPAAPARRAFTLRELVDDTLAFNPELKFYEAEISAAKGQHRRAGEWPNPTLGVELGQKRATDASNLLVGEGLAWSVSISQTFDFTGRPALRKAIANRQVELAQIGLEQFKKELEAACWNWGAGS